MRIDLGQPSGQIHRNAVGTSMEDDRVRDSNFSVAAPSNRAHDDSDELPDGDGMTMSGRRALELNDSMEFESKEDAFRFYKEYAVSAGFCAIIKASRRSRISGKFIDAKFVCSRYGSKRDPSLPESSELPDATISIPVKKKRGRINRSCLKTDCKACVHVKRRQDGRWIISSFIREHNHDIVLDQAGVRIMSLCQKDTCALNTIQSRKKKICMPISQKSGRVQKTENHESLGSVSSSSSLGLGKGDVQVMLEYFSCMQDENPYFFYAMDFNQGQHLRNVFWVDAKGRMDYCNFGDVVFFDTLCKKNEFKLPFTPFIGMNNHFQFLLLGGALVSEESKSAYVWVLRAWLRSMHGQAPKVILTDQDQMLKEAIAEVLPESCHCFCLWHILSKIQEKLGHVIKQHENFESKFYKCILKPQTESQFEKKWWKLVNRFDLRNDMWTQSLYDDRRRWIPIFMKDISFAGLSSAQRLESISYLLDKCLLRKTSLKEFLHQYNAMLQEKYEDEAKAELDTWHKQPGLKSPSPYEKQLSTLYTHTIFKKFQVEILGVVACHPKIESQDDATTTFKVQDFEENQAYLVLWNETTSDTSCTCRLFEYNGFLCRHVMIVLQISGVNNIPGKYILKRWTKGAKNREKMRKTDSTESRNQRYNGLCQRACGLIDEGSLCQESYSIAFTALEEALRKCENINNKSQTILRASSRSDDCFHELARSKHASKTTKKGETSGKEKVHQEQEATTIGMHCLDQMGYSNFRAAGVCSSESQESMQEMEQINLTSPTFDGIYGNTEIALGVDQCNTILSGHVDYSSQLRSQVQQGQLYSMTPLNIANRLCLERLHPMGQLQFRPQNVPSSLFIQDNSQNQQLKVTER